MLGSLGKAYGRNRDAVDSFILFWFTSLAFTFLFASIWGFALGAVFAAFLYATRHPEILKGKWTRPFFSLFRDAEPEKHVDRYINALVVIYCIFLLLSLVSNGIFLQPEQMLFFGLVGALYLGRGKGFIRDWLPLIILIVAYEAMMGVGEKIGPWVHYTEMIDADKAIFGVVPSAYLQERFFVPGAVMWYDVLATAVYLLHFSAPLFLAFFFWTEGRAVLFKRISGAIILTTYICLVIFLLFPAAPPWLASSYGYLPNVQKVLKSISDVWGLRTFWTTYMIINANPVAAMPSLHAAYPWIVYLYARKRWEGKLSYLILLFPIAMGLSLVYLGEHYVVDILAGILVSSIAYLLVESAYKTKDEKNKPRVKTLNRQLSKASQLAKVSKAPGVSRFRTGAPSSVSRLQSSEFRALAQLA